MIIEGGNEFKNILEKDESEFTMKSFFEESIRRFACDRF